MAQRLRILDLDPRCPPGLCTFRSLVPSGGCLPTELEALADDAGGSITGRQTELTSRARARVTPYQRIVTPPATWKVSMSNSVLLPPGFVLNTV
jgi:hypothetical protein